MLLVGASHEMGMGVKDDETFENVLEDRLNRELAGAPDPRFEILNLSVGDTCLFRKWRVSKRWGLDFSRTW